MSRTRGIRTESLDKSKNDGCTAGVSSDLSFGFIPRDCLVSDWSDWSDCSRDCVGLGATNSRSHTGAGQPNERDVCFVKRRTVVEV